MLHNNCINGGDNKAMNIICPRDHKHKIFEVNSRMFVGEASIEYGHKEVILILEGYEHSR
jgi:hypothetical protein